MDTTLLVLLPVASLSVAAIAQPQLTSLGRASHANSYATAISADGAFVAGFFEPGPDAFIWSAANGMVVIQPPNGVRNTVPYAVSSNGVVAGEWRELNAERSFRWTSDAPAQDLGELNRGHSLHAWAMSDDGQVIVGSSGPSPDAFRWTIAGGLVDLAIPEGYALAISADASAIAGNFNPTSALGSNLFRWTQSGGIEDLGTLGTNDTYPYFISPDASIIVGTTYDTELFSAFRWTSNAGIQLLELPVFAESAAAQDASDDASLIVGYWIDFDYEARGAIWTSDGAFDLLAYLQSLSTTGLDGWVLRNGVGVSSDGSAIIGTGTHDGVDEAFIVTGMPHALSCPPCPADYDQDGGVTGSDIGAFIAEWQTGATCADVDADGGITGSDLAAFFAVFEAGGC